MNASRHSSPPKSRGFVIVGAGYLARQFLERFPDIDCRGCFVDEAYRPREEFLKLPVYGRLSEIRQFDYLLAVGNIHFRSRFVESAEQAGMRPASPVTTQARFVSDSARIHDGTILGLDVIIEYDSIIGPHCLLMDNVLVAHDARIGDNVLVAPGAFIGRSAQIGRRVFIGANAAIAPGVTIGDNCHIAMGATCFRDVPAGSTVIGNPGRLVAREPGAVGGEL